MPIHKHTHTHTHTHTHIHYTQYTISLAYNMHAYTLEALAFMYKYANLDNKEEY